MSKHEKTLRRERRNTEKARRHAGTKARRAAVPALAAAAAIAAGTAAYAEAIRFDNPAPGEAGHFHWPSPGLHDNLLDVTLPASSQPGDLYAYAMSTIGQRISGGVSTWSGAPYVSAGLRVLTASEEASFYPLLFNAGELIPVPGGCTYYGRPCSDDEGYLHYPGYAALPEGVPTYLGVLWGATYEGGGFTDSNYGWLGVVRNGAEVEAFAWGYETEVGVPIPAGIPEPGTLALLAFGALGVASRRRRAERN